MKKKRKPRKVPSDIAGQLLFKTNLLCCVCKKKGVHIHHLNGNKYDHRMDNLAYLCFPHHDKASTKGSLSRKLSKEAIIHFREQHYLEIANARQKALGAFDKPIVELTDEKLLIASKNAIIILEIEKIKKKCFSAGWDKKEEILGELDIFINHSNPRLAFELFDFFDLIGGQARAGMTYGLALTLYGSVLNFFPSLHDKDNRRSTVEIAGRCIRMGYNLTYDACLYINNLAVAMCGLTIIKYVYRSAKENNISGLTEEVNRTYSELEEALKRKDLGNLDNAKELVKTFKDDLNEWSLSFPVLPGHLMKIVEKDYNR